MNKPLVVFDIETAGLAPACAIIQLAAAASLQGEILSTFETKIQFSPRDADPEALKINGYTPEAWIGAALPDNAARNFSSWLENFKCIDKVSKAGKKYRVARLAGYNAAVFDGPRLQDFYRDGGIFLPADYKILDIFQLTLWYFYVNPDITPPLDPETGLPSLKLGRVCEYFGIPLEHAHDALSDCIATAKLAHLLTQRDGR